MNAMLGFAIGHRGSELPWTDPSPARGELFGIERLEQHAESLAAAQPVTDAPAARAAAARAAEDNAAVLLAAYRASAAELESGRGVVPAAEWLLDNYHVVEEQIREIRDDLPPGYYRQLPKLADGPFAGYPRVFGLAWAFVAHTDSRFDPETLRRFVAAYQRVQPLTIGELWAVAITLRIVLVENLRRLADQITVGQAARAEADALADRAARRRDGRDPRSRPSSPRAIGGAAVRALRRRSSSSGCATRIRGRRRRWAGWRSGSSAQGTSVEEVVRHEQQRQGASNVTVRNVITSMRLISDIDWAELFESVSLVDARLRAGSAFAAMDFATRNLYRSAIEELARGSDLTETRGRRSRAGGRAGGADGRRRRRGRGDPGYYLIGGGRRGLERALGFRPPAAACGSGRLTAASASAAMSARSSRRRRRSWWLVAVRRCGCRASALGWLALLGAGRVRAGDRGGDRAGQPRWSPDASARRPARAGARRTAFRRALRTLVACRRC